MKTLIIYDSKYGNTAQIARAIAEEINAEVRVVTDATAEDFKIVDLLILGSPTHGGFPTEGIHQLSGDRSAVAGVRAAAFDTRTKTTIFGYASPKIGRRLTKSGAELIASPEGFYVTGMEGPLVDGELERAAAWGKRLSAEIDRERDQRNIEHDND